jgi:type II secretory pathway pseudopilin PulG
MNRRRGISLIEMIAVMGVGAVMMGVAVTLLYGLLRAEGSGREHLRQSSVLGRLADQFRRDVHAANTVGGVSDGDDKVRGVSDDQRWQFELAPGRTVIYRFQPGTLTRTEQVDAAPQRRESYALPPGTTATIRIPADTQPAIVSLRIEPAAEASGQPAGRSIQIDAVLARDHRFAKPEEP